MIFIFFSHLGTKSLKKKPKRKVGPSTSKCSVEVYPSVVTKKRKKSENSFHQLPESAKEVMDSGPFEFLEVTKHCNDFEMLEDERIKVKAEQCNDNEKLEEERMRIKDCIDDELEEERMKVKIEDCTDEDVIVKVEHDIDEDDISKSASASDTEGPPTSPGVAGPSQGRKRASNHEGWKRVLAKAKRNNGEAYISPASQRAIPQRVIGAPCHDGCFTKVTQAGVQSIFHHFWGLADYNLQNAYIQKMIDIVPVKRKRTEAEVSRRSVTRVYHVSYNNMRTKVCLPGFMAMHNITKKRIDNAIRKMTHTAKPLLDLRGHHKPANKIEGRKADHVREHIRLLPAMTSHYSRTKAPNRLYLDSTLNIRKLYDMYLTWMSEQFPQDGRVSFHYYSDVFTCEFNISFEPPKVDTCTICDTLQMALSNATTDQEKADQQAKLDEHKREAKKAQDFMKRLQDDNDPETRAVCIDLQQILPTPKLHTSVAYYKRKLWTYNFCIHNLKTKVSTMFVWDETVAKCGSVEVASCLKKWLELEYAKGGFGRLVVISDNCPGQNKNINLILMYLRELHSNRLFEVDHIYLIPGHSYMACDRAFGNIERKIANQGVIYTPGDYIDAIKNAVAAGSPVIKMTQDDFFSFDTLSKYITKRKAPGSTFKDSRKIFLRLAFLEGYLLKSDYEADDENVTKVRLQKGRAAWSRKVFDLSAPPLPKHYSRPIALKKEKVCDLQYLLALMPANKQPFYNNIIDVHTAGITEDIPTDEDADDLDELLEYE
ncbi:hypothetical protein Pcinc_005983 [Petrolisthes cinctipes]|uniref:DUF7869 domain-containing protein n=1 Tax=Petrolisthes cinctipes TaxID=88211 RepID=A0AAE1GBL0_PETCI|nr:hypothetical protein Pcinc_005983 [Petrolisthes cinctipes]